MGQSLLTKLLDQAGPTVANTARDTGLYDFALVDFKQVRGKSDHDASLRDLGSSALSELRQIGRDLEKAPNHDLVPIHISTQGLKQAIISICETRGADFNHKALALGLIHSTRSEQVRDLLESDRQFAILLPISLAVLAESNPEDVLPVIENAIADNSLARMIPLTGDSPSIGGLVTLLKSAHEISKEHNIHFDLKGALSVSSTLKSLLRDEALADLTSYNWNERKIAMNAVEMIKDGDPRLIGEVSARRFGAGLRSVQSIVWPSVVGFGSAVALLNAGGSAAMAGLSFLTVTAVGYEAATRIFNYFTGKTIENARESIARAHFERSSIPVRPEEE